MFNLLRASLLCAIPLVFVGCGGSSDGGGTTTPIAQEFSGQVVLPEAPVGLLVAMQSVPVSNATVEVIEVDDLGNQVGEVIATTTTDNEGRYTIELPSGVSFGPNLMVRVVDGPAAGLRALVVSDDVDVSAASEYLLLRLTSDGNTLANVSAEEVLALSEVVDEFDDQPAASIEDAIQRIHDGASDAIDPAIEAAVEAAGDATDVAGDYHFVQFALEMDTLPIQLQFGGVGTVTLTDEGGATGSLVDLDERSFETEQVAMGDGNGGATYDVMNIFEDEFDVAGLTFEVTASGTVLLQLPAFEEIDGDLGSRSSASIQDLRPFGSRAFVSVFAEVESEYELTDGEIDLNKLDSRVQSFSTFFAAPQEPVTNASLDGAVFGRVVFGETFDGGLRELTGEVGLLTFSQEDATTGTLDGTSNELILARSPQENTLEPFLEWNEVDEGIDDPIGEDQEPFEVDYELDPATGAFRISDTESGSEISGFIGNGGDLLVMGSSHDQEDRGSTGIVVALRLGNANPTIDGKSYRLLSIQKEYGLGGHTAIARLNGGTVDVTGTDLALTISDRVVSKDNDLTGEVVDESESGLEETGSVTFTGTNGAVTLDVDGSKLRGYFNADGSLCVLRLADSDLGEDGDGALMGIVILIEQ